MVEDWALIYLTSFGLNMVILIGPECLRWRLWNKKSWRPLRLFTLGRAHKNADWTFRKGW